MTRVLERATGIEPVSEAWEASILPLYDARSGDIVPANGPAEKRRPRKSGFHSNHWNWPSIEVVSAMRLEWLRQGALAIAQQRCAGFLTLGERSFSVKICGFAVVSSDIAERPR
jgi:hypothetical protein